MLLLGICNEHFFPFNPKPAFGIKLDCPGIDFVFLREDARREGVFGVVVQDRDHGLDDDRTRVHALVHEMHGAA